MRSGADGVGLSLLIVSEGGLVGVGDVQEAVGVFSVRVHGLQQSVSLEHVSAVDEEVERVLFGQLYSLADDERELVGGQVGRGQVSTKESRQYTYILLKSYLLVSFTLWQLG